MVCKSAILAAGLILLLIAITPGDALAACLGTGQFQNCYENVNGNTYSVQRMGNTTYLNGSNSATGTNWRQTSTSFGNTTFHNGSVNGNNWNMTDQRIGNTRILSGNDSQGHYFNYTCNQFGCY